jgi:hypothetical protein
MSAGRKIVSLLCRHLVKRCTHVDILVLVLQMRKLVFHAWNQSASKKCQKTIDLIATKMISVPFATARP